ncbi:MAG: hypothetical protein HYV03_03360 [Deltaproteobacteria bacterium]|nr:hypothetical protein [Deltaproteobacteria bacterium]
MALGGGIEWKQEAQLREKIYFFAILLLVVVMFARVLWGPKAAQTRDSQKQVELVSLRVETLKKRLGELKKLQASRSQQQVPPPTTGGPNARFDPYRMGAVRSRQEVMSEVIRALTGPQALQGLVLNGHSIGSDADAGSYLIVPLEFTIEGPFAAMLQYLDKVEELPLLLTVDNVTLTAPAETPDRVQAKLATAVYVVKSAAAITGEGPSPGGLSGAGTAGVGGAPAAGGSGAPSSGGAQTGGKL